MLRDLRREVTDDLVRWRCRELLAIPSQLLKECEEAVKGLKKCDECCTITHTNCCARCKKADYCSRECQISAWKNIKKNAI